MDIFYMQVNSMWNTPNQLKHDGLFYHSSLRFGDCLEHVHIMHTLTLDDKFVLLGLNILDSSNLVLVKMLALNESQNKVAKCSKCFTVYSNWSNNCLNTLSHTGQTLSGILLTLWIQALDLLSEIPFCFLTFL